MSYNPEYEATKVLPMDRIARQLQDFEETGRDLSRRRFSRSPPSIPSIPSTTYDESNPPSPDEILRDKETKERINSTAEAQFKIQTKHEMKRIEAAASKGLLQQPALLDRKDAAEANVKYRWIQQGIWDERWDSQLDKTWKHELLNSHGLIGLSKPASDTISRSPVQGSKRKHFATEEEYKNSVCSAIEFHNQQLSRPCYQFVCQFREEREWVKMGLSKQDQNQHRNLDTEAYENLKSRWIEDGIWDDDWTAIPGMYWKHERPRKNLPRFEDLREADTRRAAKIEQAERPPQWYFIAPLEPPVVSKPDYQSQTPSGCTPQHSSPDFLGPDHKGVPPRKDRSTIPRTSKAAIASKSTRQPVIKVMIDVEGNGHDKTSTKSHPRKSLGSSTRTKAKRKISPKQEEDDSPPACSTRSRAVKKQASTKKAKRHITAKVAKKAPTTDDGMTLRSHRATVSKVKVK